MNKKPEQPAPQDLDDAELENVSGGYQTGGISGAGLKSGSGKGDGNLPGSKNTKGITAGAGGTGI